MFKKSWSRGCRKRIRDEAAHMAQVEEAKEPMLMLATAEAEINASSSSTYSPMAQPPASTQTPARSTPIHLEEDKLFI